MNGFNSLAAALHAAQQPVEKHGLRWIAELTSAGACPAALMDCERAIDTVLSPSHRQFLERHDGARFGYMIPIEDSWFAHDIKILSLEEVVSETQHQRSRISEVTKFKGTMVATPGLVIIATYGDGDCCLNVLNADRSARDAVVDGFHETFDTWALQPAIAPDVETWIRLMLESLTLKEESFEFWLAQNSKLADIRADTLM